MRKPLWFSAVVPPTSVLIPPSLFFLHDVAKAEVRRRRGGVQHSGPPRRAQQKLFHRHAHLPGCAISCRYVQSIAPLWFALASPICMCCIRLRAQACGADDPRVLECQRLSRSSLPFGVVSFFQDQLVSYASTPPQTLCLLATPLQSAQGRCRGAFVATHGRARAGHLLATHSGHVLHATYRRVGHQPGQPYREVTCALIGSLAIWCGFDIGCGQTCGDHGEEVRCVAFSGEVRVFLDSGLSLAAASCELFSPWLEGQFLAFTCFHRPCLSARVCVCVPSTARTSRAAVM